MNVEIITIGDEILIGQIVDTNSAWMAQLLDENGFAVTQITSVPDIPERIKEALKQAMNRTDIVLMTGGLGPTKDDKTLQTLCEYFNTRLVFSETVYAQVEAFLARYGGNMNELNRFQAYVPENAVIIQNEAGTAPITWFEQNGKVVVSMPGVPTEMKWVMNREIVQRLKHSFHTPPLFHKHFLVYGYPESMLAIKLKNWESALPPFVGLAYLPSSGMVKLRLNAEWQDFISVEQVLDEESKKLHALLGNAILADEDIPMEVLTGNLLKEKKLTLSTAESCTGGNIARLITSVEGSSEYYKGSVVAYDNTVKEKLLNVSPADIAQYGAVSLPVVEQMAKGVLQLLNTGIAVATSGIAGPGGGTDTKPVGTVCIAVATKNDVVSRQFLFGKLRDWNITRSTLAALVMIKEVVDG